MHILLRSDFYRNQILIEIRAVRTVEHDRCLTFWQYLFGILFGISKTLPGLSLHGMHSLQLQLEIPIEGGGGDCGSVVGYG